MVGYFGGAALRELSHGLATYILRGDQPLRLLVSPVLSDSDQEGIRLGTKSPTELLNGAIESAFADETALASALAQHTKQCFAYLLATRRLLMKVVLVKDAKFHLKEWIFRSGQDLVVLSGSANFTGQALLGNVERLNLHRSWRGGDSETASREAITEFEAYWSNSKPHAIAVDLPVALREGLIESYDTSQPPTEADYRRALKLEGKLYRSELGSAVEASRHRDRFAPPHDLVSPTTTRSSWSTIRRPGDSRPCSATATTTRPAWSASERRRSERGDLPRLQSIREPSHPRSQGLPRGPEALQHHLWLSTGRIQGRRRGTVQALRRLLASCSGRRRVTTRSFHGRRRC